MPWEVNAEWKDMVHTGPNTLAGRFMRTFWQPVYLSQDLKPGQAVPIRVMSEDFTLYRGETGKAHLVEFRCAHRGAQLSLGWVEEDCIRCYYHGWKYDGSGECVDQPAEYEPFTSKIRLASYPVEEYLGIIFAYIGKDNPPPLPRYSDFENPEYTLETDTYVRRCNFFQNAENILDAAHIGFVHSFGTYSTLVFDGRVNSPKVFQAEETDWGISQYSRQVDGNAKIHQFGMPNIGWIFTAAPEKSVPWRLAQFWWVPIDDNSHRQFGIYMAPVKGEAARDYLSRQKQHTRASDEERWKFADKILAGELRIQDFSAAQLGGMGIVTLQDDVVQQGQGQIVDRESEHLGREDTGIIMIRNIWSRELKSLAEGRQLKKWVKSDAVIKKMKPMHKDISDQAIPPSPTPSSS